MLALIALAVGCSRGTPSPARSPRMQSPRPNSTASAQASSRSGADPIVLDYRYGWYHSATGRETLAEVAQQYERDPELVGQLNQMPPGDRPPVGVMLYIPPNNTRAYVREALIKINAHPEIVPREPYRPKKADPNLKRTIAFKRADGTLKIKSREAGATDPSKPDRRVAPDRAVVASAKPKSSRAPATGRKGTAGGGKSKLRVASASVAGGGLLTRPSRSNGSASPRTFAWPVKGEVVTAYSEGWQKACHGIEIAAPDGTPVHASRPGKVLLAQKFPGYGKLILIDHGDGFASAYAYIRKMMVRENDRVQSGQQIASVGRPLTGASARLFFQIRRNGRKVDPMEYLH